MQEIELKFLVPQARLKGLMRQVKVKSSQTTMLSAHYFDTLKQELAKHGIGLRIRREGDAWVQTIKAGGDGIAARLEHNQTLDNELVQAMLESDSLLPDLSIYQETTIAAALGDLNLNKLAKTLTRQYITDVERITRLLVSDEKQDSKADHDPSIIEIAYDYGKITNGNEEAHAQEIKEIEFELISGEVAFLFEIAKVWCKRYKLCLSSVTKAERGGLLVNGKDYSPAVSADLKALALEQDISMPAFMRATVHNCLLQILPNSSAIVAGSQDTEHVRQLLIAIDRLRSALKAYKKFSDQLNPEWSSILKQTSTLLNDYHQLAYLASAIESKLQQSGAPKVIWSAEIDKLKVKSIDAIRANDFQLTLLELIAFTMSEATGESKVDKLAKDRLAKVLSKQQVKLLEAQHHFDDILAESNLSDGYLCNGHLSINSLSNGYLSNSSELIVEHELNSNEATETAKSLFKAQHKLRKQISQMRYVSEFAAPLHLEKKLKKKSKKQSKRWLKRLKKAQQALEQYADGSQYHHYYQAKSKKHPSALYGAGWFAAQRQADAKQINKRLAKLQDTATFW